MATRLYGFRTIGGIVTNYGLAAAAAAGAYMLAQPWTLAVAGAASTYLLYKGLKANKDVFENELKQHPKVHFHSPKLGKIVENLYKESGLHAAKFPVYDFVIDEKAPKKKGLIHSMLRAHFGEAQHITNAAALYLDKPVILISEPLLKLLNDSEEEAVLAHEFAHAAARHNHLTIPQKLLGAVTKMSNSLVLLSTAMAGGFWSFAGGVASVMGLHLAAMGIHPRRAFLFKKTEDYTFRESIEYKKITKRMGLALTPAYLAIFNAIAPGYAAVWAATTGIKLTSRFADAALSRSLEYQADKGAVELGANPLAMISALRKVDALLKRSYQNAWGSDPVPKPGALVRAWNNVFSTHPTLDLRVARLADMARRFGYEEADIQETMTRAPDISNGTDIPYNTLKAMASRFV